MAETHDTIDGLLAEFRGYSAGMPASYHVTMSWADFRRMLDRFDAAHRREVATTKESLAVGNSGDCAKLREALEYMFILIDGRHLVLECETTEEISGVQGKLAEARAALAAPARNCDVGTAEEQAKRLDAFCDSHGHGFDGQKCYSCENCKLISIDRCELAWAQMPFEEGGAK